MTIKDAKAAAEIAANCPEACILICMSLETGIVLRPKDMTNAAWNRAVRYMESRGLSTIDPITGAYKLQGPLADQLFGEKRAKPRKEKQDEPAWITMMEERGGDPQSIYIIVPEQYGSAAADFYREQLALAYEPKPGADIHERDWPQPYKDFIRYVKIVALLWGKMGKNPLLDNVLAMPVAKQLSFENMGMKNIAAAKEEMIIEVLQEMDNWSGLRKKTSVALTLNNWISRRA